MADEATIARRRATLKNVAARAGVSTTTVSRALNGKTQSISPQTHQRVIDAARDLNYRPNSLAISLRKRTTRSIGLLVPDISDSYFHQVARAVEDTAHAAGYTLVLCNTDRLPAKEIEYVDLLGEKQVDGIIFAGGGVDDDRHLAGHIWAGTKLVVIGPHRIQAPSIRVDDRGSIAAAVGHLAQQGCRHIACIGGEPNWLIHQVRMEGFLQGLRENDLELEKRLVWPGNFRVDAGYNAIRAAISKRLHFDGVLAFNDYSALGAVKALRDAGFQIPSDVAVIGCDDIEFSTLMEPPLSSIAFPLQEFGRTAVRMLTSPQTNQEAVETVLFPFELRLRASSLRVAHLRQE